MRYAPLAALLLVAWPSCGRGEDAFIRSALAREVVGPRQALLDVQDRLDRRIPRLGEFKSAAEWEVYAAKLRREILDRVVFRGEAARWRDAKWAVTWEDAVPGGEGYRLRKLRYEAAPGLWVPAVLYEPTKAGGKTPVVLAVNGHDGIGKAAGYKQTRCINLAKRGMPVLNVEWFGMGQLKGPGYRHYSLNQLDLCGTSGVAPFYLALTRGIDVLLSLPGADPDRVAVSGLSGGGWQTILVGALDPRVRLANPVAGYSGFRVKVRDHLKDLGDSEQTACDLGTLADYTHLTALRAPRPTLLTYNRKDDCCYEAGYALPPLLDAAGPIFKLYGKPAALRSHVNDDPGTHNYEKDNRQAFYRMIGDFFFPDDKPFRADEIPCAKEIKTADELAVGLPPGNADFNQLARTLAKGLPREGDLPPKADAAAWQAARRALVRERVRPFALAAKAAGSTRETNGGTTATFWKLRLGDAWTVPVVEFTRGKAAGTTVLLNDAGRQPAGPDVEKLLAAGQRVLAVDPFYFGECKLPGRDYLFALLLGCLGDRPLGLQVGQVTSVARWAGEEFMDGPVTLHAVGPRLGAVALVAAALETKAIGRVEVQGGLGSFKELIEKNRGVDQMPELFCFGLLEAADVRQLVALVAPRPVTFLDPSERVRREMEGMGAWYGLLGKKHGVVVPAK